MVKRISLFGVCVCTTICAIFLLAFQQSTSVNRKTHVTAVSAPSADYNNFSPAINNITIDVVISDYRKRIVQEIKETEYEFVEDQTLESLTLETGGQPLRNIIITTWRSGSTFLGDILNSAPANYYHYEPLLNYDIIQIRGPPHAEKAIENLKALLKCNYTGMEEYLEYGKSHVWLFTHNIRLWEQCKQYPEYCWNSTFLNQFCRLFPFQSMKVVRLRLRLAEELLKDEQLPTVKIVLLVRDPRGTLQSRKHRDWCPYQPDCENPELLCADMVADYSAAIDLLKKYPDRVRVIRYEDFSLKPQEMTKDLFKFFGMSYPETVDSFLRTHTKWNLGGVSSTYRNSTSAPFHWRNDLSYSEVSYIEKQCSVAMDMWGYVKALNESNLREFNPITDYKVER